MAPIPEKNSTNPRSSTDHYDQDVRRYQRLAQTGGYTVSPRPEHNYRGLSSSGVSVYQDDASKTLPKGWKVRTQADGINAYSNGNLELKADVKIVKRRRKQLEPKKQKQEPPKLEQPRASTRTHEAAQSIGPTGTVKATTVKSKPRPMVLVDPKTTESPGSWIDQTLVFIGDNYKDSGLNTGVLSKLKELNSKGKITVEDLGPEKLGGYNHLTGKISLNTSKFGFLNRNFRTQIEALQKNGASPERIQQIKDQHARAILELSGTLVHEGEHAFNYLSDEAADETSAFTVEQLWYHHLDSLNSEHKGAIGQLSRSAEFDSKNSPTYKDLDINAPSYLGK